MILVDIVIGSVDRKAMGVHGFATTPRAGERAVIFVSGEPVAIVIKCIFHITRPQPGRAPEGEPTIWALAEREAAD